VKDGCLQSFSAMMASLAIPSSITTRSAVCSRSAIRSGQFYTREDVELLTTMADQAAVASKTPRA